MIIIIAARLEEGAGARSWPADLSRSSCVSAIWLLASFFKHAWGGECVCVRLAASSKGSRIKSSKTREPHQWNDSNYPRSRAREEGPAPSAGFETDVHSRKDVDKNLQI